MKRGIAVLAQQVRKIQPAKWRFVLLDSNGLQAEGQLYIGTSGGESRWLDREWLTPNNPLYWNLECGEALGESG